MPTTVRARGQTRAQTGPFRGPGTALREKDERCTTHGGSHGARSVPSAEFRSAESASARAQASPSRATRGALHHTPAGGGAARLPDILSCIRSVHPVKPYIRLRADSGLASVLCVLVRQLSTRHNDTRQRGRTQLQLKKSERNIVLHYDSIRTDIAIQPRQ